MSSFHSAILCPDLGTQQRVRWPLDGAGNLAFWENDKLTGVVSSQRSDKEKGAGQEKTGQKNIRPLILGMNYKLEAFLVK